MPSPRTSPATALLLALCLGVLPGPATAQDTADTGDDDPRSANDADGDGVPDDEDCEPNDNTVFPGNEEYNDGKDNDCDGEQPPLYGCGKTDYALFLPLFLLAGRRQRRKA